MKNMMKLFMRIFHISMCLVLLVGLLISNAFALNTNPDKAERKSSEKKIYSEATIDQNFDGRSILVVMDKNVGGINKQYKDNFFGDFPKESIVDLTKFTGDVKSIGLNEETFRQILEITLPEDNKENVLNVIKKLEKIDGIKYVGPNYISKPCTTPNDPNYTSQWGLSKINAPSAWNITVGSSSVKVGIIDTGIASHSDLNANLISGWNFVNDNGDTTDTDSHGTHVAGIVGAVGNNTIGVSGVCQNVTLVPLKISGYTSEVIAAVSYATQTNIPILNFSFCSYVYDPTLEQAIVNYPGLFICAAGNETNNNDTNLCYASDFDCANIISVGASDRYDNMASFSNYGATTVDLFAPGKNILSTVPGGYDSYSGTSMATPFVAGVAALIKSAYPYLNALQIKSAILNSVDYVSSLSGKCVTNGRLNAYNALNVASGYVQDKAVSGDFNGDGRTDIATLSGISDSDMQIQVTLTPTSGVTAGPTQLWSDNQSYHMTNIKGRIVAGDFNGDGMDDIAAMYDYGNHDFQLHVWLSTGTSFSGWYDWKYDQGWYDPSCVTDRFVSGDFDCDGKDDIAAMYDYGNHNFRLQVWLSSGTAFTGWYEWKYDQGWYDASSVTGRFVAGDFNNDGKDDIAAMYDYGNHDFRLQVWLSSGTAFTGWYEWKYDPGWYDASSVTGRFVSGDFNGDGKDDLAAMYDYGSHNFRLHVWLSSGTAFNGWYEWLYDQGWYDVSAVTNCFVAGNFFGDSKTDLATRFNSPYGLPKINLWESEGNQFERVWTWQ